MSKSLSIVGALICTFIWGTTFIAQDTGMELIGPYVFNTTRFFVGFLALIPFYLILEKKETRITISKNKNRFIILAILIGFFFISCICFPASCIIIYRCSKRGILHDILCSNGSNNCFFFI